MFEDEAITLLAVDELEREFAETSTKEQRIYLRAIKNLIAKGKFPLYWNQPHAGNLSKTTNTRYNFNKGGNYYGNKKRSHHDRRRGGRNNRNGAKRF